MNRIISPVLTCLILLFSSGLLRAQTSDSDFGETDEPDTSASCKFLEQGLAAYEAQAYTEAIKFWELGASAGNGLCAGSCFFNIPLAYIDLQDFDQSRIWFQKILDSDLNDRDPGPDIMEPYANYHHNACMEWGLMEYRQGNYARAISLFNLAKTRYDVDIFSATTYEKRLVSIAMVQSMVYLEAGHPDSAVAVVMEKGLDTDWRYKGDFSSFTNVDMYSLMFKRTDSLAEATFGKAKLFKELAAASKKVSVRKAEWEWSGMAYSEAELTVAGMRLRFGMAKEDATPKDAQEVIKHSPLWRWLEDSKKGK